MNALRPSARMPGNAALLLGKLAIYVSSSDTRRRILAPPRQGCRFSPACGVIGGESRTFNATVALPRRVEAPSTRLWVECETGRGAVRPLRGPVTFPGIPRQSGALIAVRA